MSQSLWNRFAASEPVTRAPLGGGSRPLRFLLAAAVVGIYVAIGVSFHLNQVEYQLLGVPIIVVFQLVIQRRPLRTLWVRSGPPLRVDRRFLLLWILFSIVPVVVLTISSLERQIGNAAFAVTSIAGAFGLAYALRAMKAVNIRQLVFCTLTVSLLGILPQLLSLILPHIVHLHIGGANSGGNASITSVSILQVALITFLGQGPAGFIVEEVFFRGALDTYLHFGEKGVGWASAIFVSALWGVWHLPGSITGSHISLPPVLGLVIAQIIVGVPLSLWWRKSGNLVVTDTAHAALDTVRNVISAL